MPKLPLACIADGICQISALDPILHGKAFGSDDLVLVDKLHGKHRHR